ncbi:F-box only protein 46 [Protopterus annectens]|uniref:F-box only protein 46 n=1 Tax=Protopterus annectens TaxID=7888 RepID=UPI001CFA1251|nr:F-box only protein 46 [Protopterus annectens]
MDQNTFSHARFWCPKPFGTYSQNRQCSADEIRKPSDIPCRTKEEEDVSSENTPPAPPPSLASSSTNQVEDGRVLLDTWYVIKPGNTKEKIAFFVAHQYSVSRNNAVKIKGKWGADCSKAKRMRWSHDSNKVNTCQPKAKETEKDDPFPCPELNKFESLEPSSVVCETDLLSVAEMVALVEQRTALALQNCHRPFSGNPCCPVQSRGSPLFFISTNQETDGCERKSVDSNKVAEAIAHFESQQLRERRVLRRNDTCREPNVNPSECVASSQHTPGEVRIAFRVSSVDSRSPTEGGAASLPNRMFMSCSGSTNGTRSKEKITCDLYQLVSPSCDPRSNNVELLLANTSPKSDSCSNGTCSQNELSSDGQALPLKKDSVAECRASEKKGASQREYTAGFHVDVVVTGGVDQCVFFGKDCTENVKEETVRLTVSSPSKDNSAPCEDPPPGQLFFLHSLGPGQEFCSHEDSRKVENSVLDSKNNNGCKRLDVCEASGPDQEQSDTSLCRLYRHVSHDFLEIRFKIQRLLEPLQYMLLLPDHIMVNIFSYLPTLSLAALKCTCHHFKSIIDFYGIHAIDSRWNRDPLYRDDPCKQCKKLYKKGDVSLCRWHPKPYHHDLPYGRSYWMCCRQTDKSTPGCRVGLHDNNWVQSCDMIKDRGK